MEAPRPSSGTPPEDPSPSRLAQEEVSRQSQLLAEVEHTSSLVVAVCFDLDSFRLGFAYGCRIRVQISKKVVNIGELRRLASQGIPDGAGIRSTIWKVPK